MAPWDPRVRIGASTWSAPSREGTFYPAGTPTSGYLSHYAARFDTVEVDATSYGTPNERIVDGWRERTPPGFLFAAKVPQVITHEKILEGCAADLGTFLRVMGRLEQKLGPLLLQFRYFRKAEFPDPRPFLERLERFLPALPEEMRFAVEVRNKSFVTPRLLELLHRHRVALVFVDHPWFFRVDQVMRGPGALTTDFCYLRWPGDRRAIERRTQRRDRLIVDRTREMATWIRAIHAMLERARTVYGYFGNHYAGSAVGSIHLFRDLWERASATGPDPPGARAGA